MRASHPSLILAVLLLAAGCASRGPAPPTVAASPEGRTLPPRPVSTEARPAPPPEAGPAVRREPQVEVCEPFSEKCRLLYGAAVAAARVPRPQSISRQLQALIPPGNGGPAAPSQKWNKEGQILMANWTRRSYYQDKDGRPLYPPGETFPLYGDTWFTAVPEVRDLCRRADLDGDRLVLRLEQLLGLPPGDQPPPAYDAFLQVWVDPTRLFRPCPDPEISDHECQVAIPVVEAEGQYDCPAALPGEGGETSAGCADRPPWSCAYRPQVSGRFVTVHPGHLAWMCQNWLSSYTGAKKYPWTALGYTYDWGDPLDPRGPSEFVVPGGETVVFESLTDTLEYCGKRPAAPPPPP